MVNLANIHLQNLSNPKSCTIRDSNALANILAMPENMPIYVNILAERRLFGGRHYNHTTPGTQIRYVCMFSHQILIIQLLSACLTVHTYVPSNRCRHRQINVAPQVMKQYQLLHLFQLQNIRRVGRKRDTYSHRF
jgi:hypothetical protein